MEFCQVITVHPSQLKYKTEWLCRKSIPFHESHVEIADGNQDCGKTIFWENCKEVLSLRECKKQLFWTTIALMWNWYNRTKVASLHFSASSIKWGVQRIKIWDQTSDSHTATCRDGICKTNYVNKSNYKGSGKRYASVFWNYSIFLRDKIFSSQLLGDGKDFQHSLGASQTFV